MENEWFGTLYDGSTHRPLRAATAAELEESRQSFVRGERGIFKVGDAERYVAGSPPASLEFTHLTPLLLASIIDLLPVGVAVATDGTAETIVGNRQLEEILGMPPGGNMSLTAPAAPYRVLVDGVPLAGADLPLQHAMRTGEAVNNVTADIVRADGVEFALAMSARPLRDEYGRVVGGFGVFYKLSDRDAELIGARLWRDLVSTSGGWYQAIANALPEHVWACRADGDGWYFNECTLEYCGRSGTDLSGTRWMSLVHPDDVDYIRLAWKIATASRGTFEAECRVRRYDGVYRWFRARAKPVVGPDGNTIDWFGTSTDIDDIRRQTAHAAILRSIVREFSIDQDVGELVEAAARHCLGLFATFCLFDVYDRDFGLVRLAFVHVDRTLEERLRDAVFETEPGTRLNDQLASAVRERRTRVVDPDVGPETAAFDRPQRNLAAIENAGKIITPVLEPDGELIGMLTFGGTETGGSGLREINVAFAEEIASLMSGTFSRSRGLEQAVWRHRAVDKLVRSALPIVLPTTEEVVFDAVHAAGRTQRDVGASWYDAIWISARQLILSSGKVTGSGVETALAMAILHQALRAAAFVNPEPTPVMAAAEKVLRSLYPGRSAAVFFAVYDSTLRELRYALRGHPRPVLRLADGSASELPGAASTPFGFGEISVAQPDEDRLRVPAGALLVLRTASFSSDQTLSGFQSDAEIIATIEHLDPQRRPAGTLLGSLCGAQGCAGDVAVLTALFR
jgi:PAS domain S-box-containing protein